MSGNQENERQAKELWEKIAEIDQEVKEHGVYQEKSGDGEPEGKTYDAEEAEKLKQKLTLKAEALEGYPWSERSHTGILAVVASVVRAVKYMVSPLYRDQVKAAYAMQSSQEKSRAAERFVKENRSHPDREPQKQQSPETQEHEDLRTQDYSNQEKNTKNQKETQQYMEGAKPEKTQKDPKEYSDKERMDQEYSDPAPKFDGRNPADQPTQMEETMQNMNTPKFEPLTKEEQTVLNRMLAEPEKISKMNPDEINRNTAREYLYARKKAAFEEAKEQGKANDWWKKESSKVTLKEIRKAPVLAKGVPEKQVNYMAAKVLLWSPASAGFFREEDLRNAVPTVLSWAAGDQKHGLEQHITWIRRDSEQIPALAPVLDEINRLRGIEAPVQDMEEPDLEYSQAAREADENRPDYGKPEPVPITEEDFLKQDLSQIDAVQYDEPEMPLQFENQAADVPLPEYNTDDDGMIYLEEPSEEKDGWKTNPEYLAAQNRLFAENEFAAYVMGPHEIKMSLLSREPELLRILPDHERDYESVKTAAMSNLSVLKYVPENTVFFGFERDYTMNDLRQDIRTQMPNFARSIALREDIPVREVYEHICRDPKAEDRRAPADRRDVEKLKEKIFSDFEKAEVRGEFDPILQAGNSHEH